MSMTDMFHSVPHVHPECQGAIVLSDDEDSDTEASRSSIVQRLRIGDIFFEFKGTTSEIVKEAYVYVGVLEEYELGKILEPNAPSHVKNPVLVGYKFQRSQIAGAPKLCWLQGTSRSIEHDSGEVVLTAVPVSKQIYIVDGSTVEIFGSEFIDSINAVLRSSSLFAAHREHGLLEGDREPLKSLRSLGRGVLSTKPVATLESLITAVYAQTFKAIVDMFAQRYKMMSKMSPASKRELHSDMLLALSEQTKQTHKLVLYSLRSEDMSSLKTTLATVTARIPGLQDAAIKTLNLPETALGNLQDEIPGAEAMLSQLHRKKKNKKDQTVESPNKGDKQPPKKLKPGEGRGGPTKPPRNPASLDDLLLGGKKTPLTDQASKDLAEQLQAQLGKFPSFEEVEQLREKVRSETLRADRECLRANSEHARAASLDKELQDLKASSVKAAEAAAAAANTSSHTETPESALVKQLRSEIGRLTRTNNCLMLAVAGMKTEAAAALNAKPDEGI